MSDDDDLFATPADLPKGDGLKVSDLEGELVILRPAPAEQSYTTSLGETSARPATVMVVTGPKSGSDWKQIVLFGAGLKAQAGQAVTNGKPLVGVIGKGTASPGKSAPWLVVEPTPDQLALAKRAFLGSAPF